MIGLFIYSSIFLSNPMKGLLISEFETEELTIIDSKYCRVADFSLMVVFEAIEL